MQGNHQTLLQLTHIRFVILIGQSCAVLFAYFYLHVELSPWPMFSALTLLGLMNLLTFARLHSHWPVTSLELFSQLIADATLYGFMLYHFGGATNPSIVLLLIPLVISVMALNARLIWVMGAYVVVIYGSLLNYYTPVFPAETGHKIADHTLFDLHMTGMWLNFVLTAIVISYFINRMNHTLRDHQQQLLSKKEADLQQQQILSLGTIAAGTAHELGTPLSTMEVILHDMSLRTDLDGDAQEDIEILRQQVELCSTKLQSMARTVSEEYQSEKTSLITDFIDEVIEHWKVMRPEVSYSLKVQNDLPPDIRNNTALRQAILNLLNNAADAEPQGIQIQLNWSEDYIKLVIQDRGPGIPISQADQLGKPFITTKGKGLGIGLFLTSSTLASFDGSVQLYSAPEGGTITEVELARRSVHG